MKKRDCILEKTVSIELQIPLSTKSLVKIPNQIFPDSISIIVPCFNEEAAIGKTIDRLVAEFPEAEIIVVDDGSSDQSKDVVVDRSDIIFIRHERNLGQGSSLRTGMKKASRDFVLWYDSDGQHDPEMVQRVLEKLPLYDCVIGARTTASTTELSRRPGKLMLGLVARAITDEPIEDLNSGLRAFRTSVIKKYLHLLPPRFSASTMSTILMLERGYSVGWVPIQTHARVGKSSVSQVRDGMQAILVMLHLVTLFRPLRFILPTSLLLFVSGSVYGLYRAIVVTGLGFPVGALLLVISGIQLFFFGLLADQLSAIRKERFERNDDGSI